MLFSSLEFLYVYLPIVLLLYFVVPLRYRNAVLLVVSLFFYGWGEPIYVFLMIFTVLCDYAFGLLVEKHRGDARGRYYLIGAIVLNLSILAFFKYCDFVIVNLSRLPFLSSLEPLGIEMPIGISFYTFQALSYVIDVYRGDAEAQRSPVAFGAYVSLFPQLIAGPIVRYSDVDRQLSEREHSFAMAASGARTFMCGLFKKVFFANTAALLFESACAVPDVERTVVGAWMGIIFYTLQIYFDFSGYSDMAIGLGKIFGFTFLENFNYPYISKSITEFWRRWHISLSSWFREYVYIPLGGNRVSQGRTYFNLFVVWFLTGFWHGSNWNFVIWGLYYFILLVIEKAFLGKWLEKLPAAFGHIYTLFFVIVGWLIFVFEDGSAGLEYLKTMFGGGAGFISGADVYELLRNGVFIVLAVIGCTPLPKELFKKCYLAPGKRGQAAAIVTVFACVVMLGICTAYLVASDYNPFLYWNF